MFNINPFNIHRASKEVLREDPAHYAAIARNNAAKQAEKDKANPEAAKKREKAKAASDKNCLLYTSPSPRDCRLSRMPSSA